MMGVLRLRSRILEGTDVLYVHSAEMALPLLFPRPPIPIVLHMHGATNPLRHSRYRWARIAPLLWLHEHLRTTVIRRCAIVISVDREGIRRCLAAGGPQTHKRCFLVPTCFDEEVFVLMLERLKSGWHTARTIESGSSMSAASKKAKERMCS